MAFFYFFFVAVLLMMTILMCDKNFYEFSRLIHYAYPNEEATLKHISDSIPEGVLNRPVEELMASILEWKQQYGPRLVLLGHHYQRPEVLDCVDYRGDSLKLAQIAASQNKASCIVLCGVYFMAESAAILAQPHQKVIIPDYSAGCPLADFTPYEDLLHCWDFLSELNFVASIVPVVYVNSSAMTKAFCGRLQGACCTSSNATKVMKWALARNERILFMPDENLGRNSARALGIPPSRLCVWDPSLTHGGLDKNDISRSNVILWKGYCHVHTYFRPRHVDEWREREPNALIIVHPECCEEVVASVDAAGSTEQIIQFVKEQPRGATIVIGTEINLVTYLAREFKDKNIYPLARSLCPNMSKITLPKLYWTLRDPGTRNVVFVHDDVRQDAAIALNNMLSIS